MGTLHWSQHIFQILHYMLDSFLHLLPYLLITIPISVIVQQTGTAQKIQQVMRKGPFTSIFIAAGIGAFSPFCACGVIPIIFTLLIGGVSLSPVMTFWLASPSMDIEIFFLTVGTLGWELAVSRLLATLVMSLGAGLVTHFLLKQGWINPHVLRKQNSPPPEQALESGCCVKTENQPSCCNAKSDLTLKFKKFISESGNVAKMMLPWMGLAFFLQALIHFYVPSDFVYQSFRHSNEAFSILYATLLGIPLYTSNLTALPMLAEFLAKGMSPAAALAFLVSGPTTTLPAMSAVWFLVKKRVFFLYLGFIGMAALSSGFVYYWIHNV